MTGLSRTLVISAVIGGSLIAGGTAFIRGTPAPEATGVRPAAASAGSRAMTAVTGTVIPSAVAASAASPDDQDRQRILTPGIDEEAGHELLVRLVAEGRAGLVGDLATIAADPRHAPGWRNYAIQHLATHHELHGDAASLEQLRRAATTGDNSVRPVAIHGLARLATGGFDHLDAEARRIAGDGLMVADPQVREASLRAAVLLGMDDAMSSARTIVADPGAPVALTLAAIDLLGLLGGSAELPLLERAQARSIRSDPAGVLVQATVRAIGRIRSDAPFPQRAVVAQDVVGVR